MHRFRSRSTITRFRISSVFLILWFSLTVASIATLTYSIMMEDRSQTLIGIVLGALALLAMAIQWATARRTHCPLCMTPVLATKGCSKHRNARKLLGSHRLWVAVSVIIRGTFTCPYCNERSEMQVRDRQH